MSSDGDHRMLKKRRESNRMCAQRRRARQKKQIEDLQEEAFRLTQENERFRTENARMRALIQEELLLSREMRQRSLVASSLPIPTPPNIAFAPPLPMARLPLPFNNPLALDEFISVQRPANLFSIIATIGLPGASQLLQQHALGGSSFLPGRPGVSLPTFPPAVSATAAMAPKGKAVVTRKATTRKRRSYNRSSSSDDDDDDDDDLSDDS